MTLHTECKIQLRYEALQHEIRSVSQPDPLRLSQLNTLATVLNTYQCPRQKQISLSVLVRHETRD